MYGKHSILCSAVHLSFITAAEIPRPVDRLGVISETLTGTAHLAVEKLPMVAEEHKFS